MKGVCVTEVVADKQGVYKFKGARGLFGARRFMLPDAVPPCAGAASSADAPSPSAFGCVVGALRAPKRHDHYIVEFLSANEYRLLAYIDRYGRVFSTDEPILAPPARKPDLMIAKFDEQSDRNVQVGCVQVSDAKGTMRQVAQYRLVNGTYDLFDSWYNFGPYAQRLPYDVALARCFLAFVHRANLCGVAVPSRGIASLNQRLRDEKPLAALSGIVRDVHAAEADPIMNPPALACCFARWLEEAGIGEALAKVEALPAVASLIESVSGFASSEPLRLVRTTRYANTYYVGVEDEESAPAQKTVWALEAALNRFLLVEEALGDKAAVASDADCGRWDAYNIETIAAQVFSEEGAFASSGPNEAREWDLHAFIGRTMELLRLPYRFSANYRCDERAVERVRFLGHQIKGERCSI